MEDSSERCYVVFCHEDIASKLVGSSHLQMLQDRFRASISYQPGQFLISRDNTTLESHQQCKHYLINLVNSYKRQPYKFQWFLFEGGIWTPFEEAVSEQIEEAFRNQNSSVVTVAGELYNIDPFLMIKSSLDGRKVTQIARQKAYRLANTRNSNKGKPKAPFDKDKNKGKGKSQRNSIGNYWVFYEGSSAKSFPKQVSQVLEEAFLSQQPLVNFQFLTGEAEADLNLMVMRNATTSEEVKIARF